MSALHLITGLLFSAIHVPFAGEPTTLDLAVGDEIEVDTEWFGRQWGIVDRIVESPFYGQEGQMVAFVVSKEDGEFWTTYISLGVK